MFIILDRNLAVNIVSDTEILWGTIFNATELHHLTSFNFRMSSLYRWSWRTWVFIEASTLLRSIFIFQNSITNHSRKQKSRILSRVSRFQRILSWRIADWESINVYTFWSPSMTTRNTLSKFYPSLLSLSKGSQESRYLNGTFTSRLNSKYY